MIPAPNVVNPLVPGGAPRALPAVAGSHNHRRTPRNAWAKCGAPVAIHGPPEDLLSSARSSSAMHVAEEMHDVFGTAQQRQVPLDDNAVETVIYKSPRHGTSWRETDWQRFGRASLFVQASHNSFFP